MQRPPPGLQAPPTLVLVQDMRRVQSALLAGVGNRDAGTTVLDTVLPGPALAGRVSVSVSTPGYHHGYAPWISSVGRAEGSSTDKLFDNVSACPPAVAAASVPPVSIGYFPKADSAHHCYANRQRPPTLAYYTCFPRAVPL